MKTSCKNHADGWRKGEDDLGDVVTVAGNVESVRVGIYRGG